MAEMDYGEPIRLPPCKWRAGPGVTWLFKGGKRAGSGGGNSGPQGKRAKRFYPGRALRKALGKHGIARLNAKAVVRNG